MSATPVLLPRGVRPIYGRLAWLDSLRFIAIAVMVVDHALLFLLPDGLFRAAVRATLTRCAEPLFVFVLTYLTIYLGRPMKLSRWWQLIAVSAVTSSVLSIATGRLALDVLLSIALAALALPVLLTLKRTACVAALYLLAALSALPLSVGQAAFDYSPLLIAYQMLLARLLCEGWRPVAHLVLSGFVVLGTSIAAMHGGQEVSASWVVVLFGHPLAAFVVHGLLREQEHYSTPITRLATRPLTIYAGHLCALGLLLFILHRG